MHVRKHIFVYLHVCIKKGEVADPSETNFHQKTHLKNTKVGKEPLFSLQIYYLLSSLSSFFLN